MIRSSSAFFSPVVYCTHRSFAARILNVSGNTRVPVTRVCLLVFKIAYTYSSSPTFLFQLPPSTLDICATFYSNRPSTYTSFEPTYPSPRVGRHPPTSPSSLHPGVQTTLPFPSCPASTPHYTMIAPLSSVKRPPTQWQDTRNSHPSEHLYTRSKSQPRTIA